LTTYHARSVSGYQGKDSKLSKPI